MPPPTSSSSPAVVLVLAAINCQASASVASEEHKGLATIEPSALTAFSQIRRSNCPAMAAAFRSDRDAPAGSVATSDSPSAASRPASLSIGIAATGGGPLKACGGSRPSRSPALASESEASPRAELISSGASLRSCSCTRPVTAGSPLKRSIAWVVKESSVTAIPPVTRCCRTGRRPPGAISQARCASGTPGTRIESRWSSPGMSAPS